MLIFDYIILLGRLKEIIFAHIGRGSCSQALKLLILIEGTFYDILDNV